MNNLEKQIYQRNYHLTYDLLHKKERRLAVHNYFVTLKLKLLAYYGNGKVACVKCGFDDTRALSIDHINGNGNTHKKENNISSGTDFYRYLKREDFPEGYQTLCMNCQYIKKSENKEWG